MPEISVIMPCFNTEESMLMKCVESVIEQTFADFELIIVDDGSRESYREVYKRDIFQDSRIKILLKENNGVSAARNYGLKYVLGEYVIFVDSDDVLLPCFFEEAVSTAKSKNVDIVYGCNMFMNRYDKSRGVEKFSESDIIEMSGDEISGLKPYMVGSLKRYENGLIYIGRGPWTRLVKKEIAVSTPFVEGVAICEDIIWNLEILDKTEKICIVKRAWYLYNLGNTGSSTKRFNKKIISESRHGLNETMKRLDMQNDREYKAFADKCFEELNRIYYGFIGHKEFSKPPEERKQLIRELYSAEPWNVIGTKRYFRLCSKKDKIRTLMYKLRFYFLYLKIKK